MTFSKVVSVFAMLIAASTSSVQYAELRRPKTPCIVDPCDNVLPLRPCMRWISQSDRRSDQRYARKLLDTSFGINNADSKSGRFVRITRQNAECACDQDDHDNDGSSKWKSAHCQEGRGGHNKAKKQRTRKKRWNFKGPSEIHGSSVEIRRRALFVCACRSNRESASL